MKKLKVVIDEEIEDCGSCIHDWEGRCSLTNTEIINQWNGVPDNCPLEDVE